jgi:cephalosporin-C deacetylase
VKNIKYLLITALGLFITGLCSNALAQKKGDADDKTDAGGITTEVTPHSSNGIFSEQASYTYAVKNTFNQPEIGKVSWCITDEFNKVLKKDSIMVKLDKKSGDSYTITAPEFKSGFYKINFMINVSDYDDTTRKVFGIKPDDIRSIHEKPGDFDSFWQSTKAELAKVAPEYKLTEVPAEEKNDHRVFKFEMKSLDNVTVRGWLTEPKNPHNNRKFPVLLGLPGYQVSVFPIVGEDDDLAIITLDVRGQGDSKDQINLRKEDFIVNKIEDKNKYVMRGVIMDCIRAVDFIYSRTELKKDFIMATGGSMGGFLAIATAALDKRITLCSAQNPIMSDIYNLDNGAVEWPIKQMKDYVKIKPGLTMDKVLDNLQYFDTKNFASTITCPALLGIGLLDPYVPPYNAYAVFNNIPAKRKKIMIFRDLAHEIGVKYKLYEVNWMNDTFGLF